MAVSRKKNPQKINAKLYDTTNKRIKTLRKKGNIITFKVPFMWKEASYHQIDVIRFKLEKSGACKIEGYTRDTPWFDSLNKLIEAVDWDIMERWHTSEGYLRNKLS
jgi:hypothetical protein